MTIVSEPLSVMPRAAPSAAPAASTAPAMPSATTTTTGRAGRIDRIRVNMVCILLELDLGLEGPGVVFGILVPGADLLLRGRDVVFDREPRVSIVEVVSGHPDALVLIVVQVDVLVVPVVAAGDLELFAEVLHQHDVAALEIGSEMRGVA